MRRHLSAIRSETRDAIATYVRLPSEERHPTEEDETNEGTKTCPTRLPGPVVLEDRMTIDEPDGSAVYRGREGIQDEVVSGDRDRQHRTEGGAS